MRTATIDRNTKTLFMAIELGASRWVLMFGTGHDRRSQARAIAAGEAVALRKAIRRAKRQFGLPENSPVLSCYEAGRDGFWVHRFLASEGIDNLVVDSSSIQVSRRARTAKSDRIDVAKLLTLLIRYGLGERDVWHVVNVPSESDEACRHQPRELDTLKQERTRCMCRMKSYLALVGVRTSIGKDFLTRLTKLRRWNGEPLCVELSDRLRRTFELMQVIQGQIAAIERERARQIRESKTETMNCARQLMTLRGIGVNSAMLFSTELFGWRQFRNRRELAAVAGLVPVPFRSGDTVQDGSISRAGNPRLRSMMVEIAWGWLRFQPQSELSRWFSRRYADGSSRVRRIGIVAVARKLLVQLWRFLETNEVPPGAVLK